MANATYFVTLGGSNTLGHRMRKDATFAHLTGAALRRAGAVNHFRNSAVGAMGPMLCAACASKYIPPTTTLATVEFLPNMGHGMLHHDPGEVTAIDLLLRKLAALRAQTVMVNIVPRGLVLGCPACLKPAEVRRLHSRLLSVARRHSVPTVDCQWNGSARTPSALKPGGWPEPLMITLSVTHEWISLM